MGEVYCREGERREKGGEEGEGRKGGGGGNLSLSDTLALH